MKTLAPAVVRSFAQQARDWCAEVGASVRAVGGALSAQCSALVRGGRCFPDLLEAWNKKSGNRCFLMSQKFSCNLRESTESHDPSLSVLAHIPGRSTPHPHYLKCALHLHSMWYALHFPPQPFRQVFQLDQSQPHGIRPKE